MSAWWIAIKAKSNSEDRSARPSVKSPSVELIVPHNQKIMGFQLKALHPALYPFLVDDDSAYVVRTLESNRREELRQKRILRIGGEKVDMRIFRHGVTLIAKIHVKDSLRRVKIAVPLDSPEP